MAHIGDRAAIVRQGKLGPAEDHAGSPTTDRVLPEGRFPRAAVKIVLRRQPLERERARPRIVADDARLRRLPAKTRAGGLPSGWGGN